MQLSINLVAGPSWPGPCRACVCLKYSIQLSQLGLQCWLCAVRTVRTVRTVSWVFDAGLKLNGASMTDEDSVKTKLGRKILVHSFRSVTTNYVTYELASIFQMKLLFLVYHFPYL